MRCCGLSLWDANRAEWKERVPLLRICGIDARKGSVVPGVDADLVALDDLGFVQRAWVRGTLLSDSARQRQ